MNIDKSVICQFEINEMRNDLQIRTF